VAFEQGAGVLQVIFGVGLGCGDVIKRCIEGGNDALLLRDRWYWYL